MIGPRTPFITGAGVETSVGTGTGRLWDACRHGRSGLAVDAELVRMKARCHVSGRVSEVEERFHSEPRLKERDKALFSRFSQLGWLAAVQALDDARFEAGASPHAGGVLVGSAAGPMGELEDGFRRAFASERLRHPGQSVCRNMPSFLPAFLARFTGATLGGAAISVACTSGLLALQQACSAIESGAADFFLVGAIDEDSPYTWASFDAQKLLARTPRPCADPGRQSRPFDATANGFVPSGGAAFVFIESLAHCERRGARPGAAIRTAHHRLGHATDASPTTFDSPSYALMLEETLRLASIDGRQIDLVVPHALSTPVDGRELRTLDDKLGLAGRRSFVNGSKSLLGYSIAASALTDVVLLAMQLEAQEVLPNWNLDRLAPEAEHLVTKLNHTAASADLRYGLKSAYAFGNAHAAVVLERFRT